MSTKNPYPDEIQAAKKPALNYGRATSYADYLQLDVLLNAQKPLSPTHDELLFIIQHQTSELWIKLTLHELRAAAQQIASDELCQALKTLTRVSKIMEQLVHSWDVLATMTPPEFMAMRSYLANSSGFQSAQYRCVEFVLGNKNGAMLAPHAHDPEQLSTVEAAYHSPSLYDRTIQLLARRGHPIPTHHTQRDWTQAYTSNTEVEQAWLCIYQNPKSHWVLYQLAEKLIDLEDSFRLWRFRHVSTVERVIGFKKGTGGTGGVSYLRKMLDIVLFPEIWTVRTNL